MNKFEEAFKASPKGGATKHRVVKAVAYTIAAIVSIWLALVDQKALYIGLGAAAVLLGIRWLIEVPRAIDNITRELREIKALLSKES